MLVLTENIFKKSNNSKSSGNETFFKSNSAQLKVIAKRITPYCREISKNKKVLIKTRKYLSNINKIKYKYSNSRNNIGNSRFKKKLKTSPIEKKKDLCQLEIFSKSKKKNQVIASRVNYNIIFKKFYLKNIEDQTNLFLLHLRAKERKKIHRKEKSKKDLLNTKELPLENLKDTYEKDFDNLHKLSNILYHKVKNKHYLDNNDTKKKQFYDKKVDNLDFADILQNNAVLDTPFSNNDKFFKPYVKTHMSKFLILNSYDKRKLLSNSLIDSIITLSNELNRTNEKKDNFKYENEKNEKNVLQYANKILHDSYVHCDLSISVKKSEIKKLECKIKKYSDVPHFYFRNLSKSIDYKNKNNHKNKCNNYSIYYDSDYRIYYDRFFMDQYNNNENKYVYDEKKKKNAFSLNSHIYANCYSDNYFSERKKKKKKKREFHHIYKSFNHINKQKEKKFSLTKKGNQNINFKFILDNQKINKSDVKESYALKQIDNINKNFKSKKKKSVETDIVNKMSFYINRDKCNEFFNYNNNNKITNSNIFYNSNDYNHINTKSSCINMYNKTKCIDKNKNDELCKTNISNDYSKIYSCNSLHYIKKDPTIFTDSNEYISTKDIHFKKKLKENYNLKDNYLKETVYTEKYSLNKKVNFKNEKKETYVYKINKANENKNNENVVDKCSNSLSENVCNFNSSIFSKNENNKFIISNIVNPSSNKNISENVNISSHEDLMIDFNINNNINNREKNHISNNNDCNNNVSSNYNISCNNFIINNSINDNNDNNAINTYNDYNFNVNNVKRNDSFINTYENNINNRGFNKKCINNYVDDNINCDYFRNVRNSLGRCFKNDHMKKNIFCSSNSLNNKNNHNFICNVSSENNNNTIKNKNNNISMNLTSLQNNINNNFLCNENKENNSELIINKFTELKSLTSSINSTFSGDLFKTPIESNIENHNFNNSANFISEDIKSLRIIKSKHKKERLTSKTSLIIDSINSHSNDINLITHNKRFNNLLFNKDIKMNSNDHDFLVDECLMKCLKENSSNFRTNEDYERYCNEDKILNPDYIPLESKKLGEKFLKSQKELFSSFTNNNFIYESNIINAECGNSCFKNDKGYDLFSDSNKNHVNNMSINIYKNKDYIKDKNNNYNNNITYNKNYINSINNEYYMKKSNDHTKDKFIKYYEEYANKDNNENEEKKLNYTDCYDFKNSLLNGLSRDDSFYSDDDVRNDDNETNFLKDSLNSFDNLESTEKKYEEILRDFNGKIPLLHKVLKPLPPKNRSNNFDICLYLLQKHGGDLNNEENICILRDKDIVEHSAIYDTKKNCIKSNITNVTNIKLYHPKWYNKKKIIERMKEQSCYNPFTIFGSAPTLLDFDEVFDKDVYNKFVSRNSRKSHSLLRILAKQKVINNLSDKISDKEWPQVHAYLKKRWSKETNLELNWACDPLLYEELEWYLSTNNEYLNMTDKVADIEVCYCPTLNPSSYYAWNDSRVIYTNLCYNKSEDIDPNNSSRGSYMINKNMELKNSDKKVSIRKRASGCEHLMFQQNIMKQKNLSKKKKLLKKKKKMLKEKNKLSNQHNNNKGIYNEEIEHSDNNYNIYCQVNKNDYISDQYINEIKNKDNNSNSYYPNIFLTKSKKSVYQNKNDDNAIPIMTINTSLYRHNMDNKYNCNNTANDYIKNKDNTIKFFASPKKTKKNNSIKKSLNNSDCFYFFNYSMINSDNIYNNNFDSFDSRNSMNCSNDNIIHFNKNIFKGDNIRNKNEIDVQNSYDNNKLNSEKNTQNACGNLETNKNNFSMNIYEMKNSKNTYVINKTNNNMNYTLRNDNNCENQNNIKNSNDLTQSFHNNKNKNSCRDNNDNFYNKNINDSSVKSTTFNNIGIHNEKENNKINKDKSSSNSSYNNNGINSKNNNDNDDDKKNSNNNSNNSSNSNNNNNNEKEWFHKNKFVSKNYYETDQMKLISSDFNNLQNNELNNYQQFEKNRDIQSKLSDPNFSEKSKNKKKFNIKQIKEKYVNICKNQNVNENYHKTSKYNYETISNNNSTINKTGSECFQNKSSLNSVKIENNNINKNIVRESEKNNKILKNFKDTPSDNILKLTQKNIDKKNISEKKIRSNISLYSKNNDTDASLSTSNSKRLSNSNFSVNQNRKIRRYTNQMSLEDNNISIEQSEHTGESNKKGSNETLSSRTSETSMSSAFKIATSVFKKLF
ncbi:conserved Plasmodium protein, unknown function [Plasmodium relictum]|uniref:Inner centromere protein ARK-binding domain-containing protein n=1 Tax=Plasmodium relictum TaxID=85471 RepID=A0A1J1HAF3_PLARL|nr:conserved Plasmodium protein, unknown function [Plasmodium relictum]CRH01792.1 conserved Plasmodium protein, unknown function [Plasmodium relictum]